MRTPEVLKVGFIGRTGSIKQGCYSRFLVEGVK